MSKIKTSPWDAAKYLKTEKDIAGYLSAAFDDGNRAIIARALSNVARARGMTEIARKAKIPRSTLYKALSPDGNPEFQTVRKIVDAFGLKLQVAA